MNRAGTVGSGEQTHRPGEDTFFYSSLILHTWTIIICMKMGGIALFFQQCSKVRNGFIGFGWIF